MSFLAVVAGGTILSRFYNKETPVGIEEQKTNQDLDGMLSNGMEIPGRMIKRIEKFDKEKIFVVDVGYGEKFDLKIYDENDGKPYRFTELGERAYKNGKAIRDDTRIEKNFRLTYNFVINMIPYLSGFQLDLGQIPVMDLVYH